MLGMETSVPFQGTVALLEEHELFRGVEAPALERFLTFLRVKKFEPGEALVVEGERGNRLFLIIKGSAAIEKRVWTENGGKPERIALLRTGETFGEMEFLDEQPRSATVRAIEPVETLVLENDVLRNLSEDDAKTFSRMMMNISRALSLRLRQTDSWLAGSLFNAKAVMRG